MFNIDKSNLLTNKMLVEFYTDIKKYEKAILFCDLMINAGIEKNFFFTKKILSKIHLGVWKGLSNELATFNNKACPYCVSLIFMCVGL